MSSAYINIVEHVYPRILKYTIFINISLRKITDRDSFDDLIDILMDNIFASCCNRHPHCVVNLSRISHPGKKINYE